MGLAACLLLALGAARAADTPIETTLATAPSTLNWVGAAEPWEQYGALPLTVELWVRLASGNAYNILLANETKASGAHWEIFTEPGSGFLCAYVPGSDPDHVRSQTNLADGVWHHIALVLEPTVGTLHVDGRPVGRTEYARKAGLARVPGPLFVGSLVERTLSCDGQVARVILTRGALDLGRLPAGPRGPEPETIAFWRLTEPPADGAYADLSPAGRPLRAVPAEAWDRVDITKLTTEDSGELMKRQARVGGKSLAIQPPEVDLARSRALLERALSELRLPSLARAAQTRDGVLRDWEEQICRLGMQLRGEEPLPPGAGETTLDREALVSPEDGDALGVLLRRSRALLGSLRADSDRAGLRDLARDLEALCAAAAATPLAETEARHGLALAACALQREIAFANPLLDFDEILFVARGNYLGSRLTGTTGTADVYGQHFTTQYFAFNSVPGGGLYAVSGFRGEPKVRDLLADAVVENGRLAGRKLTPGAFLSPDLAFDGSEIAFAYTENREHRWVWSPETTWNLFRVRPDGAGLRQITDGPWNDFDPCWLPDGRLAFISERRGGFIRCFLGLQVPTYVLHSVEPDGSDVRPMSYFETSEWHPSVNHDGMIVYTRWDYVDRENCLGSNIWTCYPDGRDARAPHGNYPYPWHTYADNTEGDSRFVRPYTEMSIRAVPGSRKYILTAAPHHGEAFGALALLDPSLPDDGRMSQLRKITPYVPFPETQFAGRSQYPYGTPWPLSEDFYLCNWWENLYLLDRFGNQVLLLENPLVFGGRLEPEMRLIDPIPLRPRPKPPVIPAGTGESARVAGPRSPATLALLNVYDSDPPFPAGTRIRWLRVTQNILKTNPPMGVPMIGYQNENTPRIPLGIVPVEEDGSAYLEAPVDRELIFQALDENYMAVQSMRSVTYVHRGEQLTCQGCHERRNRAPQADAIPLAWRRTPSRLEPEIGAVEPIGYYRTVKPVFERACLPCHTEKQAEPLDFGYAALEPYAFYFAGGMSTETVRPIHGGSRTIPGRFGARASRIGQALLDPTHRDAVAPEDYRKIVLWLDSNSPRLTAYEDEEAQVRGALVWPSLDVDPANPQGLER